MKPLPTVVSRESGPQSISTPPEFQSRIYNYLMYKMVAWTDMIRYGAKKRLSWVASVNSVSLAREQKAIRAIVLLRILGPALLLGLPGHSSTLNTYSRLDLKVRYLRTPDLQVCSCRSGVLSKKFQVPFTDRVGRALAPQTERGG